MKTFIAVGNIIDGEHEFLQHFSVEARNLSSATKQIDKIVKQENEGKVDTDNGNYILHDSYTQSLSVSSVRELSDIEKEVLSKFCII